MQVHTTQAEPVELNERAKRDQLSEQDLAEIAGGLVFTFKLVAVKTIGWANDDSVP